MPSTRDSGAANEGIGAFQRFLAAAATLFVALALVGFALTLVQIGLRDTWTWLQEGAWPYVFAVPVLMLPLGFVCSLLGVNIGGIPLQDASWAFWALLGVFAIGVAVQIWMFRRRGWLKRD